MTKTTLLCVVLAIAMVQCLPPRKETLPRSVLYPHQTGSGSGHGRIAGGQSADPFQFPFFAKMILHYGIGSYACDGVILSETRVLSSGYCADAKYNDAQIRAGLWNNGTPADQYVETETFIVHPDYNPTNFANDIGMLDLTGEPFVFNDRVQAIPIAQFTAELGDLMTIVGSGSTDPEDVEFPGEIHYAEDLVTIPKREGIYVYPDYNFDDKMCLRDPQGVVGACYLDYGGPAINANGEVAGISLGFTAQTCNASLPQCYTDVKYHNEWIIANM